ncbi:MAG: YtxH domain-containing protein [Bacteroidales bacterium]|nr:YtxH domain-containing protein [Bacteroides sp.]MCM1198061.1 YtxH domain-containing protein [Clostridium sp.]MCM1501645.1 YtxH domain-containing protein [Bacteroidales bacterium]
MSKSTLFAFLAGAAAGAATAYFLSSEKTADTRKKIAEGAEELYGKVKTKAEEAGEKVKEATHKAKDNAKKKFEPVKGKLVEGLDAAEAALENL